MSRASKAEPSPRALLFFNERREQWRPFWRRTVRRTLRQFEQKLREEGITFREIPLRVIDEFCEGVVYPTTRKNRRCAIRQFLLWYARHFPEDAPEVEKLFPQYMAGTRRILPPFAEQYLAERIPTWKCEFTAYRVRTAMCRLHGWLGVRGLGTADLTRERVREFLADTDGGLGKHTRRHLHRALGQYLDWLAEHGQIPEANLSGVLPTPWYGRKRNISQPGRDYLKFLPAVVTQGTQRCHHSGLANFFTFLHKRGIDEDAVDRALIEAWIQSLCNAGIAASTRGYYIQKVRHYFHWRHDRSELAIRPELLLSKADIPKRPKLLPRPFPPDVDVEIQRRLRESDQLIHRAILLLRHTGLRAQELCFLPDNCVQEDHAGRFFLKVPIGKLKNERLVPLDSQVLTIISEIRRLARAEGAAAFAVQGPAPLLVQGTRINRYYYQAMRAAFHGITLGLPSDGSMGLHRLRHTYATELLNAGMSLYSVMQILGHKCVTSTLIYAGVTQKTIYDEYFAAIAKIRERYTKIPIQVAGPAVSDLTPDALADDLARSLRRLSASSNTAARPAIRRLIKRVDHLRIELKHFP